jgi:hypothetical protein
MTRWERLYAQLAAHYDPSEKTVPKPAPSDLVAFEKQFCITLPNRYKQFILVFGAGELNVVAGEEDNALVNTFRFLSSNCPDGSYDMIAFNAAFQVRCQKDPVFLSRLDNPNLISRLVFFATNDSGDYFGWDPEERSSSRPLEYSIHWWPRGNYATEFLSPSFLDFMDRICKGDAFFQRMCGLHEVSVKHRYFVPLPQ